MVIENLSSERFVAASKLVFFADFIQSKLSGILTITECGGKIIESFERAVKSKMKDVEKCNIPSISSILDQNYKRLPFTDPLNASRGTL
jgi:prolyl-tRNA synthetase